MLGAFLSKIMARGLYNYLLHKVPGPEDAQDLVNETMLAMVRAIATFDGNVTLLTFLFSLAGHKVVDFYRRHQKTTESPETLVDVQPGMDGVEFQEIFNSLSNAQYREVLIMRYQIGLGVDEIAVLIGKNYKSTELLLSRAKQELKKRSIKHKKMTNKFFNPNSIPREPKRKHYLRNIFPLSLYLPILLGS